MKLKLQHTSLRQEKNDRLSFENNNTKISGAILSLIKGVVLAIKDVGG